MKHFVDDDGKEVYEFEDSEQELSDEFQSSSYKLASQQYVIGKLIEGIACAFSKDFIEGVITKIEGEDFASGILAVSVKEISTICEHSAKEHDFIRQKAYACGLPTDKAWEYSRITRQFKEIAE